MTVPEQRAFTRKWTRNSEPGSCPGLVIWGRTLSAVLGGGCPRQLATVLHPDGHPAPHFQYRTWSTLCYKTGFVRDDLAHVQADLRECPEHTEGGPGWAVRFRGQVDYMHFRLRLFST